jgi:hypothetical protein
MFEWIFGKSLKKRVEQLEEQTKNSFLSVREDVGGIGDWIKHLNEKDKQLFSLISSLKLDLSSLHSKIDSNNFSDNLGLEDQKNKQVFKKLPVLDKHLGVDVVGKAVQTAVQTGNFYENLKGLSGNERLLILSLSGSDMKLSYEDLALLLGKERSTIRGQINSIKQKSSGLIEEIVEKNGKKRVFVPDEVKQNLHKYSKSRLSGKGGK